MWITIRHISRRKTCWRSLRKSPHSPFNSSLNSSSLFPKKIPRNPMFSSENLCWILSHKVKLFLCGPTGWPTYSVGINAAKNRNHTRKVWLTQKGTIHSGRFIDRNTQKALSKKWTVCVKCFASALDVLCFY